MDSELYNRIYNYLENNQYPDHYSPQDRKQLQTQARYFIIYNKQLFKKPNKRNRKILKVIQRKELEPVLYMKHNHPTSGHLGIEATFNKIKERYYWYQMFDDIREYVQTCDSCQRFERPTRTEPLHTIPVGQPFERVGIDIVGPLPRTARGNKYIVVAVDYLTK